MKFKVGDKVKFLNEKGGGTVTKIITNAMVNVSTEEGFEIPFSVSELINVSLFESSDESTNTDIEPKEVQEDTKEDNYKRISPLPNNTSINKKPFGVYLAFIPQDQHVPINGSLDVYLVNYTNSEVLYSLYFKESTEEYFGAVCGKINVQSKLFFETIEKNELEEWAEGSIQLIYHKNESSRIIPPIRGDFKIKAVKFLKEDNYKNYSFLDDKAFLVSINEYPQQEPEEANIDANALREAILTHKPVEKPKEKPFIDKYKTDSKTAEVDMHIWELVDNHSRMTNGEMVSIQLNHLIKCMDSAIANHLTKVIFIHGVGNGTLRTEVRKTLDTYDGIEYLDASMAKYGVGATEVVIYHNR